MDWIELHSGRLKLVINPSVGGSIARFDMLDDGGFARPVMRGSHSGSINVLEAACFPLVPFVNRIRGSRFTFRGRDVVLKPNMAGDPSVLHGQGWLAPWTVLSSSAAAAEIVFEHEAGDWPWSYEARQHFSLDQRGFTVRLSCLNSSPEPMPCGLGQHPYFPCGPETVIDTRVTHAWEIDEHVLPTVKVPAEGRFDLGKRKVCGQGLDHGFAGWSGELRMYDQDWPAEMIMSSPDSRFFQLYSPAAGGLFVAEPVTHANAAINEPENDWKELGLRVLEAGEEMTLTMRIDVRPG